MLEYLAGSNTWSSVTEWSILSTCADLRTKMSGYVMGANISPEAMACIVIIVGILLLITDMIASVTRVLQLERQDPVETLTLDQERMLRGVVELPQREHQS